MLVVAANPKSCNAAMKLVYEHNDVIEDVVQRGWGLDCLAVIETQSMVGWLPDCSVCCTERVILAARCGAPSFLMVNNGVVPGCIARLPP